jgi:hypothetical protein
LITTTNNNDKQTTTTNDNKRQQPTMYALRSNAKAFSPGAVNHVIKRVSWHPQGITEVNEFEVIKQESLARGRKTSIAYGLHKTHEGESASKIRDNNEDEAVPFKASSFNRMNDIANEYLNDNIKDKDYNMWIDNSEHIIPGVPPVYTAPLYRINTCKGVPLTTPPVNISERFNYCDN